MGAQAASARSIRQAPIFDFQASPSREVRPSKFQKTNFSSGNSKAKANVGSHLARGRGCGNAIAPANGRVSAPVAYSLLNRETPCSSARYRNFRASTSPLMSTPVPVLEQIQQAPHPLDGRHSERYSALTGSNDADCLCEPVSRHSGERLSLGGRAAFGTGEFLAYCFSRAAAFTFLRAFDAAAALAASASLAEAADANSNPGVSPRSVVTTPKKKPRTTSVVRG